MEQKVKKQYLVLFVSVVSVSTAAIWIKLLSDVPSPSIAFWRMLTSSLFIAPVYFQKQLRSLGRKELLLSILSAFFLAGDFTLWTLSLKFTSVASSIVLVAISPLFIMFFSLVFLRKKPEIRDIISTVIAIFGIILIGSSDLDLAANSKNLMGDLLATIAAASIAGYLMVGQKVRQTVGTANYIAILYPATAFFLIFPVLFTNAPLIGFSNKDYLYLVCLGLIPQLIGHTGFSYALKKVPAFVVSLSILFEPVLSIIWAFLLLSEGLTLKQISGGILVLFALYNSTKR
ncbi:MAG: EamA family transporter [Epsilonproteobacteria bacterium]|nr:EamA family transporter [Campylobacterota bacterium]